MRFLSAFVSIVMAIVRKGVKLEGSKNPLVLGLSV